MSRLLPLFLLIFLTGCAAQQAWKMGQELDASGQDWAAAQQYILALDRNPNLMKARTSLIQVAHDAFALQLKYAQGLEAQKNWPEALKAYQILQRFVQRAEIEGSEPLSTIDLAGKIEEMQNSAAQDKYVQAEAYFKSRNWKEAVASYQAALSFKPNFKDAADKIGLAYYGAGEDLLAAKQYRSAAESFEAAGATKDAKLRAASIYGSLGKYMLDHNWCRQAVRDLRLAQASSADGTVAKNLVTASSCAATPVAILPFENPTGLPAVGGVAVADALSDGITLKIQGSSSEFLQLLERSSINSLLTEQGISSSKSASVSKLKGVRYLILGKFTQVLWQEPMPQISHSNTVGTERFACSNTDSAGQVITTTCERPVNVGYLQHRLYVKVQLAGTIRVVDAATGQQLLTFPLNASAEDSATWADSFTTPSGALTSSVDLDPSVESLANQRQTIAGAGELAKNLIGQLVASAASVILDVVDAEAPWSDPATLTIVTLK